MKKVEGVKGGRGIFVLLYSTRTVGNLHVEDSTNVHILNHLQELGLGEYVVVNLFSTVTQSKLSTKGLALDTDNLNYIKDKIFKDVDGKKDRLVVAWGNSHQTSKVVNQAKLEISSRFGEKCTKKGSSIILQRMVWKIVIWACILYIWVSGTVMLNGVW